MNRFLALAVFLLLSATFVSAGMMVRGMSHGSEMYAGVHHGDHAGGTGFQSGSDSTEASLCRFYCAVSVEVATASGEFVRAPSHRDGYFVDERAAPCATSTATTERPPKQVFV